MKIDGRDLMWFMENDAGQLKAVSYGSTCTLDVTGEVQEKANDTDGNSREYIRGLISWTIRAQHMMCMSEDVSMIALLKSRTPMLISLSTVEPHEDGKMASDEVPDGRMVLTGRAFLTSYNVKANVNGKVTYEITMQGTGDIVEAVTIN